MIAQATAAATHSSPPPGLFLLAWGLGASALGLLIVTNFRGFADNFARRAANSSAGWQRRPPRRSQWPSDPAARTKRMRLIAIPFAIIGPIVTVVGLVSISRHGLVGSGPGALHGPFRYLWLAFAVVIFGQSWLSRNGLYRPAARRGGWHLAAAVVSSLGGLVFGLGIAIGQLAIAIAGLAVAGLLCLFLVMDDKPTASGPGGVSD